ncbi:flagellin [Isoptericola sp. b441]|uniref:Flagellin n=1 Tax=Actinotalea lenta TaxID=3064654 RepID=A0ABT9D5Q4_9CELL|nr:MULTISPECIES: flagellin [unclassified Isoptericola]MDO8106130.1 flagellin [Isoptericola sp. b441]MDO8122151.1 flagellin [Isoptericola sp. b490]
MGLSVNTNIAALNAYRNLSNTQNSLNSSLEKLSSGLRINRAADDAAGLSISEGLRSQINGTQQAVRNAQDGISVVQTAEGALTETHSILQRMRTLSVQAANDGGLSTDAKASIQSEMTELNKELDRIASTTQFNGSKLLDGSYTGSFQVGANTSADDKIGVTIGNMSATALGVAGVDVTTAASNASTAVLTTAAAGGTPAVLTVNGPGGATVDFTAYDASKFTALNGTVSVGSKSFDLTSVDFSSATDTASSVAAIQSAADAALGSGAVTVAATATGLTFTGATPAAGASATEAAATEPVFQQASGATQAINLIDSAITKVSTQRSNLGAIQNRFDHTINNLNVANENLTASESRIRDTDMAAEMVQFTRAQILSQAGTAMLAQAKSLPQSVLQLLR